MDINNFIAGLPVTVDRTQVISQLRSQLGDATDNVLPAFKAALTVFNKQVSFQSQLGRKVEAAFSRQRLTTDRVNWISDVIKAVENVIDTIPYLITEIEKINTPQIARAGIDLRTANILEIAESSKFMLNYAPQLLLWVYTTEGGANSATVQEAHSPGVRSEITNNLLEFVSVVCLYNVQPGVIKKRISDIARVPVTGIDFNAVSAVDRNKVEAVQFSLMAPNLLRLFVSRMSYRIGKIWAEHSVREYNAQVELKNALELRLIELKLSRDGKTDAVLTQRIKYTEDRLAKLTYQIKQYEER